MKTRSIRASLALTILALASLNSQRPIALAGPGELDTSFGGTGKIRIGFGGGIARANATTVQPDGKLILAGYNTRQNSSGRNEFLLARFDTNNVLDSSFGDHGKVLTPVGSGTGGAIQTVNVQDDGRIIAAGYAANGSFSDFAVARYNPDGSLDTTLGTNGTGIVYTGFGQLSQIRGMTIQLDGKIVVAGYLGSPGAASAGIALARYQTNGTLDTTFGSAGKIATPGSEYDALYGVMIESDAKIVAVGSGDGAEFAIYRFTTNGVPDTSFGGTGHVFTGLGGSFFCQACGVATQVGNSISGAPDKIVMAGNYRSGLNSGIAVLRYNLNGSLDTTFGSGGIVTNVVGLTATAVMAQGQLFSPRLTTVAGYGSDGVNQYFALVRFTTGGGLDTTFGTGGSGKVLLPLGSAANVDAAASAMTLQSGDFVLAGYRGTAGGEYDIAAARFTSSGLVDINFGVSGLLLANLSDAFSQANAVAVQIDGKMVVAGHAAYLTNNSVYDRFALARFNSDGSLDASFGVNGKQTTILVPNSNDDAYALAIQPNGKIIAAGASSGLFAMARYNPDGSLDPLFGNNGTTNLLVGTGGAQANAIQIQTDGKILAGGYATDSGGNVHYALARFNSNGIPDTTFGTAGQVVTSLALEDLGYGAGIQRDGKIVLAGFSLSSSSDINFAAIRYTTNGQADSSFGFLGRATANVGGGTLDVGYAMAIQPDGKIVVAGGAGFGVLPGIGSGGQAYVAVVRFNTNGTLDSSFDSSGGVVTQVGTNNFDYAAALALQPDGKIVVAGPSQNGDYKFFGLRYASNGLVDVTFGTSGAALLDFGTGTNEYAYALALDPSGRAVLAGDADGLFGVARLQGDSVVSPSLKIFLSTTNAVVVSWPYPSIGWDLRENTNLGNAPWSAPSETIHNDGTNNFIITDPPAGNRFYRLYAP